MLRETTDAEATSRLRTIFNRRLLDKRRTFVRRAIPERLRGFLGTEAQDD
jgi:hypothetical protein